MKPKQLFVILLVVAMHLDVPARSYTRARVTDFFHFVRTKYTAEYTDATDFFTAHPEWSKHLISIADSLIRSELKVKEVLFDMSAVTFREVDAYAYGSMLTPVPAEGLKQVHRAPDELYVAIVSTLPGASTATRNNRVTFHQNLLLKVIVENEAGKKVYEQKVKVPFYLQPSGFLYQPGLNSEDFRMIYEEAVQKAFTGGKRFKKRPLNYRPLHVYDRFTDHSTYLSIRETDRISGGPGNYEIVDTVHNNKGLLILTSGPVKRELTERILGLNLTSRLRQHGTMKNSMDNRFYDFVAGLVLDEHISHGVSADKVIVVFREGEKDHGIFVLHNPYQITGHWDDLPLRMEYIEAMNVFELYMEDTMCGVLQAGKSVKEGRKWRHHTNAFFRESMCRDEHNALLGLFMAYQVAYEVEMEAIREAEGE